MDQGSFLQVIAFVKVIYQAFPIGKDDTHVALITVAGSAKIWFGFNSYLSVKRLDAAVARVRNSRGPLRLASGFNVARTRLFAVSARKGIPNVLIVFASNNPGRAFVTASANARVSGILVFAIGTRANVKQNWLNAMASTPQFSLRVPSVAKLMLNIQGVADKLGQGKFYIWVILTKIVIYVVG